MVDVCKMILDTKISETLLRKTIFDMVPSEALNGVVNEVTQIIRPSDDVYFQELDQHYRRIRRFLPFVLEYIHFDATPARKPLLEACKWLRYNWPKPKEKDTPPLEIVGKAWQRHVQLEKGKIDFRAYTFCVLDNLRTALRRHEIFVTPGWRYADPRAGLLDGAEWEATRPIICRTLKLSATPDAIARDNRRIGLDLPYSRRSFVRKQSGPF
jgi:hypothetical protein